MNNLLKKKQIKSLLKEVEVSLESIVSFDDPFIKECALSNARAGGKRLRPLFVMLSARYFGKKNEDIIKCAALMELVHMSSLIHDDVNDNSFLRRGQKTINAIYSNDVAVHVGDYILIEALKKVYELPHSTEILKILSDTAVEMSRGEIAQIASMFDINQTIDTYNYRIERKTALLIAICCQIGAILSEAQKEEIDAFYQYGYHLGMAFQIKDDLLDIMPSDAKIGKPIGHDLENGLINLPTILALEKDFSEKQDVLKRIQSHLSNGKEDIDYIMSFVLNNDIIKQCERHIFEHIDAAKNAIRFFDENETKKMLFEAADYIYERSI